MNIFFICLFVIYFILLILLLPLLNNIIDTKKLHERSEFFVNFIILLPNFKAI